MMGVQLFNTIHHVLQAAAGKLGFAFTVVGSVEDPASVIELCNSGEIATHVPESTARHLARTHPALMTAPILEPALDRLVYSYTHADIPKTGAVIAVQDIIARLVRAYRRDAGAQGAQST